MALIRLCYAADLPGPEEALKALREGAPVGAGSPAGSSGGGSSGGGSSGGGSPGGSSSGSGAAAMARLPAAQAGVAPQALAQPQSFDDVLALIDAKRDVGLKLDVEQFVRPISFRPGAITYEPAPGAPSNLAGRLVSRLKEWTGQPWLVAAEGGGGAESAWERQKRADRELRGEIEADPFVRSVMAAFPGTEIVGVRKTPAPDIVAPLEEADDGED
jgi:DNA polymerase-3 subunit gamma/tau